MVDRLLDNEQHGVRWSRYWLDVLRYADLDGLDGSVMPAAPGIYLWRDWVIQALNHDMPYDQFVRAQILGNRYRPETATAPSGRRTRVEGSVEDSFALGFLARSAVTRNDRDHDIPFAAVETISTAFMGMTVGCAKCHDHKFDPITQKDFYAMKAIFDPLVLKSVMLATPAEIFANGQKLDEFKRKSAPVNAAIEALTGPYQTRLYDERVALLTPEVQAMIRKPERDRTPEEQKIFDDYYPVLRIDPRQDQRGDAEGGGRQIQCAAEAAASASSALRRWPPTGRWKKIKALLKQKSYVLTTGDPKKPEKDNPVEPGFPFQPANMDFRDGRREAFVEWLTAPAESAVRARRGQSRLGLAFRRGPAAGHQRFRTAGRQAVQSRSCWTTWPSEFVAHDYSMKWLHRLIVTSDTYQLSSKAEPRQLSQNIADRRAQYLSLAFPPAAPGSGADLGLHPLRLGRSGPRGGRQVVPAFGCRIRSRASSCRKTSITDPRTNRRGVYMVRGYIPSTDVMNNFLTSFDVDDGRTPCPVRTQTVTAPQALFTMNNDLVEKESEKLAGAGPEGIRRRCACGGYRGLPANAGPQAIRGRTRLRAHLYREGSRPHEGTGLAALQSGRIHLRKVNHERSSQSLSMRQDCAAPVPVPVRRRIPGFGAEFALGARAAS